jgi:hypothetical protein
MVTTRHRGRGDTRLASKACKQACKLLRWLIYEEEADGPQRANS